MWLLFRRRRLRICIPYHGFLNRTRFDAMFFPADFSFFSLSYSVIKSFVVGVIRYWLCAVFCVCSLRAHAHTLAMWSWVLKCADAIEIVKAFNSFSTLILVFVRKNALVLLEDAFHTTTNSIHFSVTSSLPFPSPACICTTLNCDVCYYSNSMFQQSNHCTWFILHCNRNFET